LRKELEPRTSAGDVELAGVPLAETWAAMLELRAGGLVQGVGLCNLGVGELEQLAGAGLAPPDAVQVELHPLAAQSALVDYCRERGILLMAHSPLGGGAVLEHPRLRALAAESGVSPAQLVLAWHRARGVIPVVGSRDPAHLRENARACGEALPAAVVAALDALAA
ncbi:MAG TPA: aldo/keto reductase, partial [Thermoanaerobaculia bacterium]|nr:aldo/keto reductase [Thermoanaerobaculia bacterium]